MAIPSGVFGNYHTPKEIDSIRIYNRRSWFRWSREYDKGENGGSQIDFLRVFAGMEVKEAVFWLLDFAGYQKSAEWKPNPVIVEKIVPLKNLINEAYAKDMSKKISSAIDVKQKEGKFIGARAAYGYLKSPEDKNLLIVDREVSPVVVRIFECKAEGMGNAGIAKMLNEEGIPSPMRYKYEKGITKNKRYEDSL